jgi:hypothetical protein
MTKAEAEARCAELNRESSGWLVQEVEPAEWRPVHITGRGLVDPGPVKATTEAKPRPPQAPDPRPGISRDVPPYGAG